MYLTVLNKIIISNPKENSKPANAKKKKDIEYKFMSSFILPYNKVIIYNNIHTISEYKSKEIKLFEFKKNIKKTNQNKQFQKTNQISMYKYI